MKSTPPPVSETRLMNAGEVANRLGLGLRTLLRMRSAGRIPAPIRLGGSVRWRSGEIDEWIARGCPDPRQQHGKGAA